MIVCDYDKKINNVVLYTPIQNEMKDYLVILIKMNTCGACIRYMPEWSKLIAMPEFVEKINFLMVESNDPDGRNFINQLNIYSKYFTEFNNPRIEYFPSILIFKKNGGKYEFYEKFQSNRSLLPLHLKNLK